MSMSPKEVLKKIAEVNDQFVEMATQPIRDLAKSMGIDLPEPPKMSEIVDAIPTPDEVLSEIPKPTDLLPFKKQKQLASTSKIESPFAPAKKVKVKVV